MLIAAAMVLLVGITIWAVGPTADRDSIRTTSDPTPRHELSVATDLGIASVAFETRPDICARLLVDGEPILGVSRVCAGEGRITLTSVAVPTLRRTIVFGLSIGPGTHFSFEFDAVAPGFLEQEVLTTSDRSTVAGFLLVIDSPLATGRIQILDAADIPVAEAPFSTGQGSTNPPAFDPGP
jgi:hypothetical protein